MIAQITPAFLEAQSDGNLSLIKDEDLQHAILKWDLLQDSAETQQARREFTQLFVPPLSRLSTLIDVIPFEEALSPSRSCNDIIVALDANANVLYGELLAAFAEVEAETETLLTQLKNTNP